MPATNTVRKVKDIIGQRLGVPEAAIVPSARLAEDLGADSLALVELSLVFEEAFDVDISDQQANRIRTVGDAIDQVCRLVQAKAQPP